MRTTVLYVMSFLAAMTFGANAQDFLEPEMEPPDPPPEFMPHEEDMRPHPPPQGNEFGDQRQRGRRGPPHGGGPGRSAVEQWLRHVQEENPEEFAKMERLRREDPRAFHELLKSRLQQRWLSEALRDYPVIHDAYMAMTPAEQSEFAKKLYQPGMKYHKVGQRTKGRGSKDRQRSSKNREQKRSPKVQKAERETLKLAKAYKKASSDEEKAELKVKLKAELERAFDLRGIERRKRVDTMDAQLSNLREKVEMREAKREQIIERRLLELTEGDPLAW